MSNVSNALRAFLNSCVIPGNVVGHFLLADSSSSNSTHTNNTAPGLPMDEYGFGVVQTTTTASTDTTGFTSPNSYVVLKKRGNVFQVGVFLGFLISLGGRAPPTTRAVAVGPTHHGFVVHRTCGGPNEGESAPHPRFIEHGNALRYLFMFLTIAGAVGM